MPFLYIVATPIGNLEDITLRAIRVLREVALIAAEDTRVTRKLLSHYDIHTPLISYHRNNKAAKLTSLMATLVEKDVALVSDAGVPGINDPGYDLVAAAGAACIRVIPIPGPSALTTALSVSGLPINHFIYLGFLPRKRSERLRLLDSLKSDSRSLLTFETPHRLKAALEDALKTLGDRNITVCKELTKLHEEVFRGTLTQAIDHFLDPRGEFTLVIQGGECVKPIPTKGELIELIQGMRERGIGAKIASTNIAKQSNISKREVYRLWHELDKTPDNVIDTNIGFEPPRPNIPTQD